MTAGRPSGRKKRSCTATKLDNDMVPSIDTTNVTQLNFGFCFCFISHIHVYVIGNGIRIWNPYISNMFRHQSVDVKNVL